MPPCATLLSSPSMRPDGDAQLGLVGDDADGARLARRAVKRALRPGEALDPGDVVDVDVERSADRRDRLLVEIEADRRQRAGVVAVAAGRNAAHVDGGEARRGGLEADRRKLLGIILEVRDVQLVEPPRADRLDADRHVLKVLLALLRGDDDLGVVGDLRRRLRSARWAFRRSHRSRWSRAPATACSGFPVSHRPEASIVPEPATQVRLRPATPNVSPTQRYSGHECPPTLNMSALRQRRAALVNGERFAPARSAQFVASALHEGRGRVRIGVETSAQALP